MMCMLLHVFIKDDLGFCYCDLYIVIMYICKYMCYFSVAMKICVRFIYNCFIIKQVLVT